MLGAHVIYEGRLQAAAGCGFALDDADLVYGYGCYETLKARSGRLWFPLRHAERLLASAAILGIRHELQVEALALDLERLVEANGITDCTLRVLLIGREGRNAELYAFALPPIVPPAGAEDAGVDCLIYHGERHFPRAKSLSMLLSTVAYRRAKAAACWDALLVNRREELTEGSRTNLFYVDARGGSGIYTPPARDVLSGVTRASLLEALAAAGLSVQERPLPLAEALAGRFGLIVTSTSSKLLPVRSLLSVMTDKRDPELAGEGNVALPLPELISSMQGIYEAWLDSHGPETSPGR